MRNKITPNLINLVRKINFSRTDMLNNHPMHIYTILGLDSVIMIHVLIFNLVTIEQLRQENFFGLSCMDYAIKCDRQNIILLYSQFGLAINTELNSKAIPVIFSSKNLQSIGYLMNEVAKSSLPIYKNVKIRKIIFNQVIQHGLQNLSLTICPDLPFVQETFIERLNEVAFNATNESIPKMLNLLQFAVDKQANLTRTSFIASPLKRWLINIRPYNQDSVIYLKQNHSTLLEILIKFDQLNFDFYTELPGNCVEHVFQYLSVPLPFVFFESIINGICSIENFVFDSKIFLSVLSYVLKNDDRKQLEYLDLIISKYNFINFMQDEIFQNRNSIFFLALSRMLLDYIDISKSEQSEREEILSVHHSTDAFSIVDIFVNIEKRNPTILSTKEPDNEMFNSITFQTFNILYERYMQYDNAYVFTLKRYIEILIRYNDISELMHSLVLMPRMIQAFMTYKSELLSFARVYGTNTFRILQVWASINSIKIDQHDNTLMVYVATSEVCCKDVHQVFNCKHSNPATDYFFYNNYSLISMCKQPIGSLIKYHQYIEQINLNSDNVHCLHFFELINFISLIVDNEYFLQFIYTVILNSIVPENATLEHYANVNYFSENVLDYLTFCDIVRLYYAFMTKPQD